MKSHYRRISKTALAKVGDLGDVGAVHVGKESQGWSILEVAGVDQDGLPGKMIAETFGGLKGASMDAVQRVMIRQKIGDEIRISRVAKNQIPLGLTPLPIIGGPSEDDDAVLAVGINPHRFI